MMMKEEEEDEDRKEELTKMEIIQNYKLIGGL